MRLNKTIGIFYVNLLLFLINVPLHASNKAIQSINVAAPISAPFVFKNKQGKPKGFLVDLLALVGKQSSLKFSISILPWPLAMHEVTVGHIDALMPTIYTDERAQFLFYPKAPIIEFRTVLLKRSQDDIVVDDITQLGIKKTIAKVRAMSMGKAFDDAQRIGLINVIEVRDFDHAIQMLATSRVDLAACVDHISNSSLKRLNLRDQIDTLNFSDGKIPAYLTFSKAYAKQHNVDEMMQEIDKVKETPEYQALVDKYLK